jgi:hypothetical protein
VQPEQGSGAETSVPTREPAETCLSVPGYAGQDTCVGWAPRVHPPSRPSCGLQRDAATLEGVVCGTHLGSSGGGAEGPGSRTTVSSRLASARHLLAPEWLTPRVSTHTIRCGAVAPPTEGERAARRVSSPCHPTKGGGARHSLGAGVREGGEGGPIGPWAGRALVWRTPAAGLGMLAARAGRAALEGCARRPGPHELLNSRGNDSTPLNDTRFRSYRGSGPQRSIGPMRGCAATAAAQYEFALPPLATEP